MEVVLAAMFEQRTEEGDGSQVGAGGRAFLEGEIASAKTVE